MKKQVLVYIVCFSIISACSLLTNDYISPTRPSPTSTLPFRIPETENPVIILPTKSQSATDSSPGQETPTISPTTEKKEITPNLKVICPDNRMIPWVKLDISPNYKLLIQPNNSQQDGYWVISSGSIISDAIPNTSDPSLIYDFEGISPNGEWILYGQNPKDAFTATLWISSVDGLKRWQVSTYDSRNIASWISDEEIIISGKPDERKYYTPIIRINPFTYISETLPTLPESGLGLMRFINNRQFVVEIYYDNYYNNIAGNQQIVLHDYSSNNDKIVLNWLFDSGWSLEDPFNIYYRMRLFETSDGLISSIIDQAYGFDIMDEMNIITITSHLPYESVMTPILLPGIGPDTQVTWTSRNQPVIAFDRLNYQQSEPRPSQFYIFNYHSMTLTDYCLDRGKFEPISYSSPDDRFLAWTEDDINTGKPKDSFVLDLVTGFIARINNVEVLGWGVINQQ